jgi:hypothetical protein
VGVVPSVGAAVVAGGGVGVWLAGGGVGVWEAGGGVGVRLAGGGVGVLLARVGVGVGVGDAFLAVGVGFAVDLPGLADGLAEALVAVGAVARTEGVAAVVTGTVHDTVYAAGLDAAATGLVTTSTASPDAGRAGGVIASAGTAFVPAAVKVTVPAAEFWPSASAQ